MTIKKNICQGDPWWNHYDLIEATYFLKWVQDWLLRDVCITYLNTYLFFTSSEKIDHCLPFEKKIILEGQDTQTFDISVYLYG